MNKIEYIFLFVISNSADKSLVAKKLVNSLAMGWELVNATGCGEGVMYILCKKEEGREDENDKSRSE